MNIKKTLALIISLVMILSFAACQKNDEADISQESTTSEILTNNISENEVTDIISDETSSVETTLPDVSKVTTVQTETEENKTTVALTTKKSVVSSEWSKEEIVNLYKNAAKKSHAKVKSDQIITMKKISVNNGQYEGLFEFITPIMSKLLANNSKETDGITGGYKNLAVSDLASAKVYKKGKNTAIEMVLKEQVSGAGDDALSGTVGHAISAVGDIGAVVKQLKDLGLPLELSEKDTKIYYTNPVVKVLVNENGEIIKGTWKYTVEIRMDNYKAFGKPVETTSVIMDNTITVNGGF